MKQIIIIADGYPAKGLPYSAFIANVAREMARQGVRIRVVAPQSLTKHWLRSVPLAPRHYFDGEIEVYRPYTITAGDGRFGWLTNWMNRLVVNCKLRCLPKPDAVYAHFWLNGVLAIDYCQKHQLPLTVATGEDIIPIQQIAENDRIWLKTNVHSVICVSTKNKNESIQLGLAQQERCHILPNAYSPAEFYTEDGSSMRQQLGIAADEFVVAFCGRFNNRKGVFRLDEALKQIGNPHIRAIYIGSPMDNCKDVPTYDHTAFMGSLPHSEIVHYLNAADVFVLPSLAEGCPNSVIEAMACGLPIISSDMDFNYDILNDANAILTDPQSIESIKNAINTLYADSELRQQKASNALQRAAELTINQRVERILNIIYNQ